MEPKQSQGQAAEASQAITEIFIPSFKPDILYAWHSQEFIQQLLQILNPIFVAVAQSLSVYECIILISTRKEFKSDLLSGDLHRFAFSDKRNIQVLQKIATEYGLQTGNHLTILQYTIIFEKLKSKLQAQIEPLAAEKGCTFRVCRAFIGLRTFDVRDENALVEYLTNQTSSFCLACIAENDFTRYVLQNWFILEGAQHIETCIGILEAAISEENIETSMKIMAVIYCGFKIQDAMGHSTVLGRAGDCRQPQKNRRAFHRCIESLRHSLPQKDFSADLGVYSSYSDNNC